METISTYPRLNPDLRKAICDILLPYGVSRISVFGSYAKGLQNLKVIWISLYHSTE